MLHKHSMILMLMIIINWAIYKHFMDLQLKKFINDILISSNTVVCKISFTGSYSAVYTQNHFILDLLFFVVSWHFALFR